MASIDERVVAMAFENSQFEQKVSVTISTLTKLKVAIGNVGNTSGLSQLEADANKVTFAAPMRAIDKLKARLSFGREAQTAFSEVESASNKVHMSGVNNAIDKTAGHFSVISQAATKVDISGIGTGINTVVNSFGLLEAAAAVALGSIVAKAAAAGAMLGKSLSLGPISAGLAEYETNMNSIQTILANTQQDGTNLKQVSAALQELNTYSDQTIYNFGEMAKNIGTFTAAGVGLKDSVQSIKGIANLSALSGSSSQQASTAMYQLSQAIAAGKVNLQDWNSVTNAGMGGKVFQKALFDTGKAMGTITNSPVGQTFEQWEKAGNNFRSSLSATQKAAKDGTKALKDAQVEGAKSVKDAQEASAESIANAATRVKDAQASSSEAIANAATKLRDTQQSTAEDVKAAAETVKEAERGVAEASKKSSADVRAAIQDQRSQLKQSAEDVKAALESVIEARKRLADALKPPSADELQAATDKLTTAQLDQADLATAIADAIREQTRSTEDLAAAKKKLADLEADGASPEDIAAATRAVEDAQTRATDATDAQARALLAQNAAARDVTDATAGLTEVQNKGKETDENVKDARDALTVATDKYKDAQKKAARDAITAEKAVTDARKQSTRDRKAAGERLTKAEKDQAKVQIKAREDVADAEKDQAKTIIDSRKSVADAEKDQAKTITDSRESLADAEEAAADRIKAAREAINGGADKGPPSWLTSDVLTATLKQFTGDMTDAQLAAMGFNKEQIKAIQATAKTAKEAATKIKTLSQLWGVIKEQLGTGWADTFKIIFGDFGEARKLFTGIGNAVGVMTKEFATSRNHILKMWKALGGRKDLIDGLKNAFDAVMSVLTPLKEAFRDIFPRKTAKDLVEMTKHFRDLMARLELSPETAENLKRTFRGVFALFSIGMTVIKEIAGVFGDLFGAITGGNGGLLNFTGSVGDVVVAIDEALKKGKGFHTLFQTIADVLKVPIELFKALAGYIGGLFGLGDPDAGKNLADTFEKLTTGAGPLVNVAKKLREVWEKAMVALEKFKNFMQPFADAIIEGVKEVREFLKKALDELLSDKGIDLAQTGLLAGIFAVLRKGFKSLNISVGGEVVENLNSSLKALTGSLGGLQASIHAAAITAIAVSIALLAGAIVLISHVDPAALTKALTAIAVGLGQMGAAVFLMSKMTTGSFKIGPIAGGLVILAAALILLGIAMKIMSTMSWEELAKGLIGIGGGLAAIGIGMAFINPITVVTTATALVVMAVALNLIAIAMTTMAALSWNEIAKGLVALGGSLAAIGIGMAFLNPLTIGIIAPGLLLVAAALVAISIAMGLMGRMDLKDIGKGLLAIGVSLVAIGIGMQFMPLTIGATAGGLILAGIALLIIAGAVGAFGKLKIVTLVKGLLAMGAALAILAVGLYLLIGTLPGSLALLAAAGALAILVPTIALLGSLPILVIVKGLVAMAAVIGVLALVGLVAAAPLLALGTAMLAIGYAMLAIAGAILIFSAALRILAVDGTKGLVVLGAAVVAIIALIPKLLYDLLVGILGIVEEIAKLAPKIVVALGLIIDIIAAFIIESGPKIALAIGGLVDIILTVLVDAIPKIVDAGWKIVNSLVEGFNNNIDSFTGKAAEAITLFLNELSLHIGEIVAAGTNLVVQFLLGLSNHIGQIVLAGGELIAKFLIGVASAIPRVKEQFIALMTLIVKSISDYIEKMVIAGTNLIIAFIRGIGRAQERIVLAGFNVMIHFMKAISDKVPELVDRGFKLTIKFLNGIEKAIRDNDDQLIDAFAGVADAMRDGLVKGLHRAGPAIIQAAEDIAKAIPKKFLGILGIHSPSKVMEDIGKNTMLGLSRGLDGDPAIAVAGAAADGVVKKIGDVLAKAPTAQVELIDPNPVITPVLDLTGVTKTASAIPGILDKGYLAPVANATLYDPKANTTVEKDDKPSGALTGRNPSFSFVQHNNSPVALSDVEIYRQTNNLLSKVKGDLGLPIGMTQVPA